MKFPLKRREKKQAANYYSRDVEIARKFAKIMYKEFGSFISGLILLAQQLKIQLIPKKI